MAATRELFSRLQQDLLQAGFQGDINNDIVSRVLNSTDNSIYEVSPLGVLSPKSIEDVELLCKVSSKPDYHALSFTPRGGGTGTNGQALNTGIIVDMSKYLTKIGNLDTSNNTITVEAGVVLSTLNKFLQPHGLFFAPHVSTENRATIGGMIANDSAGKGSLVYGKTSDYIVELTCVLIDGTRLVVKRQELTALKHNANKLTELATQVQVLLAPHQAEIERVFPRLSRPLSGYNLKATLADGAIDLTKLIAGAEGSLVFVTHAKLKLTPLPKHSALVVTHYTNFLQALHDGKFLITHKPLAVETVDEVVQQSAKQLPIWANLAQIMGIDANASVVSNFSEFVANTTELLENNLSILERELQARNTPYKIIRLNSDIAQLWNMRALAVGLVGRVAGSKKPIAFVEDAIVPPQCLPDFVAEFKAILDEYGLKYAMYGHSDVGCIHVRPALDLADETDKKLLRVITERVFALTQKYGGLLWGEHGKGFRGEFVPETFGTTLYPLLQQIKYLFDPHNRMNPGKLVTPPQSAISVSRIDEVPLRATLDTQIQSSHAHRYLLAMLCNGNAACFNQDAHNVMCPSYKVTLERHHSPKGRAMLLKEWLRYRGIYGDKHKLTRQAASATYDAMQGCLGCKGCAGKCPTLVSIPDLRTRFYQDYYAIYGKKSMRQWLFSRLENILLLGGRYPRLWNYLVVSKLPRLIGMVNIPKIEIPQSLNALCQQHNIITWSKDSKQPIPLQQNSVVILADVFSGVLDHKLVLATCNVVKQLKCSPLVILPTVSGKAFITYGEVDKFTTTIKNTLDMLAPVFTANVPVIGLENSITLLYRDEYAKFIKQHQSNIKVQTLAELVADLLLANKVKLAKSQINKDYYLLAHCTEQAICPLDAKLWQQIFAKLNATCHIVNLGCCGMAGGYGHQVENIENSKKLFYKHWQSTVVKQDSRTLFMATGYSCRSQTKLLANIQLTHPIQEIDTLLTQANKKTGST